MRSGFNHLMRFHPFGLGIHRVDEYSLVGPPDYYCRFGFTNFPDLVHKGVPQEVFLVLPFGEPLGEPMPKGTVTFHAAFSAES